MTCTEPFASCEVDIPCIQFDGDLLELPTLITAKVLEKKTKKKWVFLHMTVISQLQETQYSQQIGWKDFHIFNPKSLPLNWSSLMEVASFKLINSTY